MPQAKLSSKGQLVVPKEVRELLGVQEGDRIDFVVGDDGRVFIRPAVADIRDLRGLLARREDTTSLTVAEMNDVIRSAAGGR